MKELHYLNDSNFSKRRIRLYWLGVLSKVALILVVPLFIFYGYCGGVWGRNSLLLQYLFQCRCPASSEEARYPNEVDVLVSACRKSWVELSPSGRSLSVYQYQVDGTLTLAHLLDLQTMTMVTVPKQTYSIYLTDDLGFGKYPEPHLVDRTTGDQYSLREYIYVHSGTYVNGDADPSKLAEALQEAKSVYFIHGSVDTVVALTSDLHANLEKDFFIEDFDIPGSDANRMERFLKENQINFQTVTSFPEEAISPDGRFIARREGIFIAETHQQIVDGVDMWLRGWTNDSSGVIYSTRYGGSCLIELFLVRCLVEVDRPVLMLKVPEEYLAFNEAP